MTNPPPIPFPCKACDGCGDCIDLDREFLKYIWDVQRLKVRKFWLKGIKLGWKIAKPREIKIINDVVIQIAVYAPDKKKRWLRISISGEFFFAPMRMTGVF